MSRSTISTFRLFEIGRYGSSADRLALQADPAPSVRGAVALVGSPDDRLALLRARPDRKRNLRVSRWLVHGNIRPSRRPDSQQRGHGMAPGDDQLACLRGHGAAADRGRAGTARPRCGGRCCQCRRARGERALLGIAPLTRPPTRGRNPAWAGSGKQAASRMPWEGHRP